MVLVLMTRHLLYAQRPQMDFLNQIIIMIEKRLWAWRIGQVRAESIAIRERKDDGQRCVC